MNAAELRARTAPVLAIPLQVALHARPVDPERPGDGLEFPVTGLALNPGGTLHAGALGAIMELSGLLALLPELAADRARRHPPHRHQILSAGREGDVVRVTAVLERRTRRLGFVTATAVVGDRLLARSQITKSVIEVPPSLGAREPDSSGARSPRTSVSPP
jgi:acyl-coenzyme A thioesterase PaaI-like protein